jgi:glycine cleavage system H protein
MSDKFDVRDELLYTKDHEWAKSADGGVAVGITAYAVHQLGDITLVNIDVAEGQVVLVGKPFGTIESVKTLSDLYAPVSGKVVRINRELETKPEVINEDCYGAGWMVVIEPQDAADKQRLLLATAYRELLAAEGH